VHPITAVLWAPPFPTRELLVQAPLHQTELDCLSLSQVPHSGEAQPVLLPGYSVEQSPGERTRTLRAIMSKRPTDHLEPSAKKRGNNRQLTKDDASDEEGDEVQTRAPHCLRAVSLCAEPGCCDAQVDPGSFKRASEDVLKARRIVKTRRNAPASVAASANPFSGVSLAVPSVQSGSASNPVNSVSDSVPRKASEEAEQVANRSGWLTLSAVDALHWLSRRFELCNSKLWRTSSTASSIKLSAPLCAQAMADAGPVGSSAEEAPAESAPVHSGAAAGSAAPPGAEGSGVAETTAANAAADAAEQPAQGAPASEAVGSSAPTTFASFAASNTASPFGTLSASGGSGVGFGFGGASAAGNGGGFGALGVLLVGGLCFAWTLVHSL